MKPWAKEAVEPLKEGVSQDAEPREVEGNEGYDLQLPNAGSTTTRSGSSHSTPSLAEMILHAWADSSISTPAIDESHPPFHKSGGEDSDRW